MSVSLTKDTVYGISQAVIGVVSAPVISRRNPTTRDRAQLGQMWVNRTTGTTYFLTNITANSYTWYAAASAAASYAAAGTVTAGTGLIATAGTGTPSGAGLHVVADGANITGGAVIATGNLSTTAGNITSGAAISATTAIQAGTSITAGVGLVATTGGLTVAADGADISGVVDINTATADATNIGRGGTGAVNLGNITANSTLHGLDVIVKLGDAAGANELSILDSGDAEVASINSNGALFVASDITLAGAGAGPRIIVGAGAPGALAAPDGSLYIRTDGGGAHNTTLYVKCTAAWEVVTTA